jgi:hypothetical protein
MLWCGPLARKEYSPGLDAKLDMTYIRDRGVNKLHAKMCNHLDNAAKPGRYILEAHAIGTCSSVLQYLF